MYYAIEPFMSTILSHGSASAYPVSREFLLLPTALTSYYTDPATDAFFQSFVQESTGYLQKVALEMGDALPLDREDVVVYGNYANADTPIENVYGSNIEKMKEIKRRWDPEDVMGLTGGWKISL
jgi:hypothetical protein